MGADWSAWLLGGLCAVVVAAGLAVSFLALFGDRSRGRRRCPRCWYDMASVAGSRCPECGRTPKNERAFFRTRRRWRRFVLGVLLLLVGAPAGFAAPRVRARGWVGAVPTTVLMAVSPWLPRPTAAGVTPGVAAGLLPPWAAPSPAGPPRSIPARLTQELQERIAKRTAWRVQAAVFQRLCAVQALDYNRVTQRRGPTAAREWLAELQFARYHSDWALTPLRDVALPRDCVKPSWWPAGLAFRVDVAPDGAAVGLSRLFYRLRIDGVVGFEGQVSTVGITGFDSSLYCGDLSDGEHDVELETLVDSAPSGPIADPVWRRSQSWRVKAGGEVPARDLERWTDARMDAFLRGAVRVDVAQEDDWLRITLLLKADQLEGPGGPAEAGPIPDLALEFGPSGDTTSLDWPVSESAREASGVKVRRLDGELWVEAGVNLGPAERIGLGGASLRVIGNFPRTAQRAEARSGWQGELVYALPTEPGLAPLPAPQPPPSLLLRRKVP